MRRVIVVVEGQTEEEFVKTVLVPFFSKKSIFITPIVVRTSQNFKGGLVSYAKFKNDVVRYLKQDQDVLVTSMVDYFRLPPTFPLYDQLNMLNSVQDKVRHLEKGMEADIKNVRFIAYIQLHEFEALLFSKITGFDGITEYSSRNSQTIKIGLERIANEYENPEMINSRPEFAPSKRILSLIPEYDKVLFGVIIAEEIGIDTILEKCPRFREWIGKLINTFS